MNVDSPLKMSYHTVLTLLLPVMIWNDNLCDEMQWGEWGHHSVKQGWLEHTPRGSAAADLITKMAPAWLRGASQRQQRERAGTQQDVARLPHATQKGTEFHTYGLFSSEFFFI